MTVRGYRRLGPTEIPVAMDSGVKFALLGGAVFFIGTSLSTEESRRYKALVSVKGGIEESATIQEPLQGLN
jgi:hypothetical protein